MSDKLSNVFMKIKHKFIVPCPMIQITQKLLGVFLFPLENPVAVFEMLIQLRPFNAGVQHMGITMTP